ncbi:MAG TPA: ABC transporter ATP-binding protein, partial [Nitriliruptorales bacterium]
ARLSVRLLRGYLAMPYEFHLQRNSSQLIRNTFDSVQVLVRDVLEPAARLVSEAFTALAVLVVLLVIAPSATLLALAILGPAIAVLLVVVHPRVKRLGITSQEMSGASLQSLAQSLEGIRDIKVLGRESAFKREFAQQRVRYARAQYLRGGARELPRAALETLLILFIIGFFAVTVFTGGSTGDSLSILGLFAYAALRLKPSLSAILAGLNSVKFAVPAIDELDADLELLAREASYPDHDVTPLPFQDRIEVVDLGFAYDQAAGPALRGIDLTIRRGEAIGIVGPTGGGKSTLVDILLGLLRPTTGRVLVDGADLHEHAAAWQRNIGVVPQAVFLIDATLRANIGLGLPADEIDAGQLAEAVELAQLGPFVRSLPDGLDTMVGERGVRVSGGQRQRIAIARALYRGPSVLFLDEGTSALDNLTEAELVRALDALRGQRTIVTVAHRLTTVRACDRIVMLEDGTITGAGSFDELMESHAGFRALASP